MPLLSCRTNQSMDQNQQNTLLKKLSAITAKETGKPEQYVMVEILSANMLMGGSHEATACVDARGIGGFDPGMNRRLSENICRTLQETLKISPDRVYITFTPYKASDWGWNGNTFG